MKPRVLAFLLTLSACATPYQEMGLLGGVEAHRISSDTAQIVAKGNAYTDASVIQRYVLRKAAEETLADGFDYFDISSGNDESQHGSVGSAYGGGRFSSAWFLTSSWEMIKPGQTILIRMLHAPAPEPLPPNVFNAHEVKDNLSKGSYVPPAPRS